MDKLWPERDIFLALDYLATGKSLILKLFSCEGGHMEIERTLVSLNVICSQKDVKSILDSMLSRARNRDRFEEPGQFEIRFHTEEVGPIPIQVGPMRKLETHGWFDDLWEEYGRRANVQFPYSQDGTVSGKTFRLIVEDIPTEPLAMLYSLSAGNQDRDTKWKLSTPTRPLSYDWVYGAQIEAESIIRSIAGEHPAWVRPQS